MPSWSLQQAAAAFDHLSKLARSVILGVQSKSHDDGIGLRRSNNLKVNQLQLSAAFTPSLKLVFMFTMEGPKAAARWQCLWVLSLNWIRWFKLSVLQHGYLWGILSAKKSLRLSIMSLLTWRRNIKLHHSYRPCWVLRYPGKMRLSSERPQAPACPWSRESSRGEFDAQGMVPNHLAGTICLRIC